MRIYKRQDSDKWGYDVWIDGKRKRSAKFKTKSEARAAAQELLSTGESSSVSFNDFYMEWVDVHKKEVIGKKAYQRYMNSLNKFIDFFGEKKKLKDITRTQYQAFINDYANAEYVVNGRTMEGHTKESVRKLHNCLSSAFDDAAYQKLIQTNPTYKISINSKKKQKNEKDKYLNEREYYKVLEYIMSRDTESSLLLFILAVTGGRFKEVRGLTLDDLKTGNIIHLRGTKTKSADREVIISEKDMDYITQRIARLPLNTKSIFKVGSAACNKELKKAQVEAGVENTITVHGLRHTHASLLLMDGIDMKAISARLGHASMSITMDWYSHLLEEHKSAEEDKITDILARKWHSK